MKYHDGGKRSRTEPVSHKKLSQLFMELMEKTHPLEREEFCFVLVLAWCGRFQSHWDFFVDGNTTKNTKEWFSTRAEMPGSV